MRTSARPASRAVTSVLRRRLPPPTSAARVRDPRLGRHDPLHHDVVPPVIAEIVDVHGRAPAGPTHSHADLTWTDPAPKPSGGWAQIHREDDGAPG
jgi:hypothetical protein